MVSTLLGIGIFGLLGLSILCPLLALPVYYFQHRALRSRRSAEDARPPSVIEIIIPAHNEADSIGATLASIQRAVDHLSESGRTPSTPKIVIKVGADACTDSTALEARRFPTVSVMEFSENKTKWGTIKALLSNSTASWVILVDVGALWPENFLIDFVQRIETKTNAIALAPAYRPLKAGFLSQILWQLETFLKRLEAWAGGPVSVHGATIGYKTSHLNAVWAYLGDTLWLNDDVVIPLLLRAFHPGGVIVYPAGQVQDAGVRHNQVDLGRRKRILMGNLQWAILLLPLCFRLNPVAGILAIRRLFRILWAYWLGVIVAGLALAFHSLVIPGVAGLAILIGLSGSFRQFIGAAWVSFLTPYRILRSDWHLEVSWK